MLMPGKTIFFLFPKNHRLYSIKMMVIIKTNTAVAITKYCSTLGVTLAMHSYCSIEI